MAAHKTTHAQANLSLECFCVAVIMTVAMLTAL